MVWNETTRDKYRRPLGRFETDVGDGEWAMTAPPSRMGRSPVTDRREMSTRSGPCPEPVVSDAWFPNLFHRLYDPELFPFMAERGHPRKSARPKFNRGI